MIERLQDTVALVTDASSGIGEATVPSLAAEGTVVAVFGRRRDRLEELATKVGADITDQQQAAYGLEHRDSMCRTLSSPAVSRLR